MIYRDGLRWEVPENYWETIRKEFSELDVKGHIVLMYEPWLIGSSRGRDANLPVMPPMVGTSALTKQEDPILKDHIPHEWRFVEQILSNFDDGKVKSTRPVNVDINNMKILDANQDRDLIAFLVLFSPDIANGLALKKSSRPKIRFERPILNAAKTISEDKDVFVLIGKIYDDAEINDEEIKELARAFDMGLGLERMTPAEIRIRLKSKVQSKDPADAKARERIQRLVNNKDLVQIRVKIIDAIDAGAVDYIRKDRKWVYAGTQTELCKVPGNMSENPNEVLAEYLQSNKAVYKDLLEWIKPTNANEGSSGPKTRSKDYPLTEEGLANVRAYLSTLTTKEDIENTFIGDSRVAMSKIRMEFVAPFLEEE